MAQQGSKLSRTGRRKRKNKGWLFLLLITALFFAMGVLGLHYHEYLFAYWEIAVSGPGEPNLPPTGPGQGEQEPDPGPDEPEPSPYPPPPGEILHITDGDYLLALVNKQTTLGEYAPQDLQDIPEEIVYIERRHWTYRLREEALDHLVLMWEAADSGGLDLMISSAYRSYQDQEKVFRDNVSRYGSEEKANEVSARPGQSEHQLGTTVDFTLPGYMYKPAFADTPEGRWLAENAHHYGFAMSYPADSQDVTGYVYEPWHFRYLGAEAALAWKESGLILSQFLEQQPQFWQD